MRRRTRMKVGIATDRRLSSEWCIPVSLCRRGVRFGRASRAPSFRNETCSMMVHPWGWGFVRAVKGSTYRSVHWLVVYLNLAILFFRNNIAQPDSVSVLRIWHSVADSPRRCERSTRSLLRVECSLLSACYIKRMRRGGHGGCGGRGGGTLTR